MENIRLDKYVTLKYPELSRAKVQRLIKEGGILVNGKKVKTAYILSENDDVFVNEKSLKDSVLGVSTLRAEEFELKILYENESCFVIDKPAGMVVHPGEGETHLKGTVANAILTKVEPDAGERNRPGIVHRLDKDTSGALLIAKTKEAYDFFVSQFKEGKVEKEYIVLVFGEPTHSIGRIDSPIGRSLKDRKKMAVIKDGRYAITDYEVQKFFESYDDGVVSLLKVEIPTGRTHQIRVHMEAIGYPVVGDDVYGEKKRNKKFKEKYSLKRQFLHAQKISFLSPDSGKEINVISSLPSDLQRVLSSLQELS